MLLPQPPPLANPMRQVITYSWQAFTLLAGTSRLWPYIALPIGVTVIVGLGLYGFAFLPLWQGVNGWVGGLSASLLADISRLPLWLNWLTGWVQGLAILLQILSALLLCWILGFLLTQISVVLAAPWYGQLAEVLEQARIPASERPIVPSANPLADLRRSLVWEVKKLGVTLVIGCLLLVLQLLPVLGQVLSTAIGLWWGTTLTCLDFWDAPLERRRFGLCQKLAWIMGQFPHNIIFGLFWGGLVSIPLLNLLLIPICVTAGTLFVCDRLLADTRRQAALGYNVNRS